MMMDASPETNEISGKPRTVSSYWQEIMTEFQSNFHKAHPRLEYIYCFMSPTTGYVNAVKPILSKYSSYIVRTNRKGVGAIASCWGEGLRMCAPELVEPSEVERRLRRMGCDLVEV
jgi:hypothetical protein